MVMISLQASVMMLRGLAICYFGYFSCFIRGQVVLQAFRDNLFLIGFFVALAGGLTHVYQKKVVTIYQKSDWVEETPLVAKNQEVA